MLECDYLIIGTGASGMAFADAIISESTNRTIIMVDNLPHPGGHWNHAYDFVKLHQPACYYGVASEKLERDGEVALHKYKDLSTKSEILSYYQFVMDKMLKTGRVRHFGECTYQECGTGKNSETEIHSFVDKEGQNHEVRVKRRLVDATYAKIQVPSTNSPLYDVATGVECIPINEIYEIHKKRSDCHKNKFVVVGAGKTGIDAVLYLMDHVGVDPANITWVISRDAWMLSRTAVDPRTFMLKMNSFFNTKETLRESFMEQEREGLLIRLDETVLAEKYSCATIEEDELEKLRLIRNVIRKGRVKSITKTDLVMTGKDGNNVECVPYEEGATIVDCSSHGIPTRPSVPIFQPGKIVIQVVRLCMICISAALIGYVECHTDFRDDDDRNHIMMPVPYPNDARDSVLNDLLTFRNIMVGFGADPRTKAYFSSNRLNMKTHLSILTLVRSFAGGSILMGDIGKLGSVMEAKKRQYREVFGRDFEHKVYEPQKLRKAAQVMFLMKCGFSMILMGALAGLFYSIRTLKGMW